MAGMRRALETTTVGKALAHDSAALHVQGMATYVDDIREPEGLLHVYPGCAMQGALGTITSLDLAGVPPPPRGGPRGPPPPRPPPSAPSGGPGGVGTAAARSVCSPATRAW
jgi:hypothetical protein